jgi:AraC family transcriptional regulator
MNLVHTLFKTPSVAVSRFDHPSDQEHADGEPEPSTGYAVSFLESGSFEVVRQRSISRLHPGDVLVSHPGVYSKYVHTQRIPSDVCLSISFEPDLIEEALGRLPFIAPSPRLSASSSTAFLLQRMHKALRSKDRMAVESVGLDTAAALLAATSESALKSSSPASSSWHCKRVEAACELMGSEIDGEHSLSSVARSVGMSAFHFARIFKQLVGQSPHQYLLRARLAYAARRLRAGSPVTETAFASGFANLSHFVRSFKTRFGVSPRAFRRLRSSTKIR